MNKKRGRIDVHHHIVPHEYVEQLKGIGIEESLGVSFPKWTPESSLKLMGKVGTETAIVSVVAPGVSFPDNKDFSLRISRWANEYMSQLKQQYPGRFGGFACVPLDFVDESIDEVIYALDELELDGVCLMTHYGGKYLGDPIYDRFFHELDRRGAVVYIHPADPSEEFDKGFQDDGIPNSLVEVTFDTTRAVTNMIYHGVTDRFKDIRYILSHGGGTIPYVAWRMALVGYLRKDKGVKKFSALYDLVVREEPKKGLDVLKNMYYDTALTAGTYALNTLYWFAGPERIVFGSDMPMANVAQLVTKKFDSYPIPDNAREKINRGNCLELFPQFR